MTDKRLLNQSNLMRLSDEFIQQKSIITFLNVLEYAKHSQIDGIIDICK